MDVNLYGCLAEFKIAAELLKRGYQVSRPLADSSVYDLIADINGKLIKIQVKSTSKKPYENTTGVRIHVTRHRKYSTSEVDYYALWIDYYDGFFFIKNKNQTAFNINPFGKYKKNFNTFDLR